MAGAQRLPNGNTLICNSVDGTIFEVTLRQEVIWKFTYASTVRLPPSRFGPSVGGSGGPPRPDEILDASVRDILKLSPEQRKDLDKFQKEVDTKLDQTLTDEQKKRRREGIGLRPGGFGGLALPGQILSLSRQISLKPTDEQKKDLSELQREVDAQLDRILTADQKVEFQKLKDDFGRGGPPRTSGGRAGGPAGSASSGPGRFPGFGDTGRNPVFRAYRYGVDYAGLAGKDLKPGKTIEELESEDPEKE
jgi:hypothetical protein